MTLPNYFIADLPPEASLSGPMITEACRTLRRNREQYLAGRSTQDLVELLSAVARQWLDPEYPFRKLLIERGPAATGFSRSTLLSGLDAFFRQLTPEGFASLIEQDLGHLQRLDRMVSSAAERGANRAATAIGPELLVHIGAGNLPCPTWMSITLGLLLRSAQFVKCASGTSPMPRLYAHSLYEADPKVGACIEIAEWRGGTQHLEEALFAEADCVTATGSDQTLAALRQRLPERVRFVGYGHRVSFGFVSSRSLSNVTLSRVIGRAATDVAAWNQLGCLSPHVIYVESGGQVGAEQFAEHLARELQAREEIEPRGPLAVEIAAAISSRRSVYELRAAHSSDTRIWKSPDSTNWTVVYEADSRFQVSCLNRFVYVKPVRNLEEALHSADALRGKVSTVGLAAPEDQAQELAMDLARWGVSRVCPLGQMQRPPLAWRHDGRPALAELVQFADWEV